MQFPTHIEDPRLTPDEKRKKRLRFLINHICLQHGDNASLREFERITGVDHSTFAWAFKHHGRFSKELAERVEEKLGKEYPKEWFMDALSIPSESVVAK